MLDHQRPNRRQLVLLMARRLADRRLAAIKDMPAAAAIGPMHDTLIHPVGRDQLARAALMARLAARPAHRALIRLTSRPTPLSARLRRIRRGWHPAVGRVTIKAPLELGDALLQPADQLPHRLGPLRMKRLCLITPHARKIPCTGQESCLRPRHP